MGNESDKEFIIQTTGSRGLDPRHRFESGKRQSHSIALTLSVMAAVGALVGAMTPLYLGILDRSDKIEQRAIESQKQANKSTEMTELSYKMLRQEVDGLKSSIADIKDQQRHLSEIYLDLLRQSLAGRSINPAMIRERTPLSRPMIRPMPSNLEQEWVKSKRIDK